MFLRYIAVNYQTLLTKSGLTAPKHQDKKSFPRSRLWHVWVAIHHLRQKHLELMNTTHNALDVSRSSHKSVNRSVVWQPSILIPIQKSCSIDIPGPGLISPAGMAPQSQPSFSPASTSHLEQSQEPNALSAVTKSRCSGSAASASQISTRSNGTILTHVT